MMRSTIPLLRIIGRTHFPGVSFFSTKKYAVRFLPDLSKDSRLIIPISMGRYNLSKKKTTEYDEVLHALFSHTASLLRQGMVSQVDILSTASLQRINWDSQLAVDIEKHFFDTHQSVLSQHSNAYTWQDWIDIKGADTFEKYYQSVVEQSREGKKWHDLMVSTHHSVDMSSRLMDSLEYQRREYAAVMLMKDYDQLIYTGPISLAWAYLYQIFPNHPLPLFTRANIENHHRSESVISMTDAIHTTRILLSNLEQTLTSPNFPKSEKEKLIRSGLSLLYAYAPRKTKEESADHADHRPLTK